MKLPEFFQLMFIKNVWVLAHTFGGMIIAKALHFGGASFDRTVVSVLAIALAWEFVELYAMADDQYGFFQDIDIAVCKIYGSWYGWAMDSLGDVVVAVLAAAIVAL